MNAVQRLYQYRKSLSTTTYKARGQRVHRCEQCRLAVSFCICAISPKALLESPSDRNLAVETKSSAGFLLLMYDTEILKPSNTGKLIADLVEDTYAFLWSRTVPNEELLAVLADPQWQPLVVFPEQYAEPERELLQDKVVCPSGKRPLFIMLDGSWREAKKMFRKSPYLAGFPVVSFDANRLFTSLAHKDKGQEHQAAEENQLSSRYQIRVAAVENQFATAEVAARVLAMAGEHQRAKLLDLWFDVFSYQYQKSVCQTNKGNPAAMANYQSFIQHLR